MQWTLNCREYIRRHGRAPLFIKPYLAKLKRQLFIVMTGGMAGIAGTVLVIYSQFLSPIIRTRPAISSSRLYGRTGRDLVQADHGAGCAAQNARRNRKPSAGRRDTMDAIVKGTTGGLELLLNIIATLIVFLALVHLASAILGLLPAVDSAPITFQRLLGFAMAPSAG